MMQRTRMDWPLDEVDEIGGAAIPEQKLENEKASS